MPQAHTTTKPQRWSFRFWGSNSAKESVHTQGESLATQGCSTPMLTEASEEKVAGKKRQKIWNSQILGREVKVNLNWQHYTKRWNVTCPYKSTVRFLKTTFISSILEGQDSATENSGIQISHSINRSQKTVLILGWHVPEIKLTCLPPLQRSEAVVMVAMNSLPPPLHILYNVLLVGRHTHVHGRCIQTVQPENFASGTTLI